MNETDLRLELFATDAERTAVFFQEVLGFVRENESPGYISLRRGRVVIGIGPASGLPDGHPIKPRGDERVGLGVEIVIEVDDVDQVYSSVEASGHPVETPIAERPWGLRDFRLLDPNGYYIRITSSG